MRKSTSSLLLAAGAGIVATATMSVAMATANAVGLLGEPPPRKLTRRMAAAVGLRLPRGAPLDIATLAAHAGFGAAMGLLYWRMPRRVSSIPGGALFGLAVWASGYMGWIPKLGLMPRPALDRPGRPTAMILAHLVFGATLGSIRRRTDSAPRTREEEQGGERVHARVLA